MAEPLIDKIGLINQNCFLVLWALFLSLHIYCSSIRVNNIQRLISHSFNENIHLNKIEFPCSSRNDTTNIVLTRKWSPGKGMGKTKRSCSCCFPRKRFDRNSDVLVSHGTQLSWKRPTFLSLAIPWFIFQRHLVSRDDDKLLASTTASATQVTAKNSAPKELIYYFMHWTKVIQTYF